MRDLDVLLTRLPIRDLKPGQVGQGHPYDRDVKLTCMLQFMVAIDKLTVDKLPAASMNVSVEGVPAAGMNPGDVKDTGVREKYIQAIKVNAANIEICNFQVRLQRMRRHWTGFKVRDFIKYDCRNVDKAHLQKIIDDTLKDDPKAEDFRDSLFKEPDVR